VKSIAATDEHALYPIHEEDTVVQGPKHDRQCESGFLRVYGADRTMLLSHTELTFRADQVARLRAELERLRGSERESN
jgi:hypothetical protein